MAEVVEDQSEEVVEGNSAALIHRLTRALRAQAVFCGRLIGNVGAYHDT